MTKILFRVAMALVLALAPLGCDASPDIDPIVRQLKGSWMRYNSVSRLDGLGFSEAYTYQATIRDIPMASAGRFVVQHMADGAFRLVFTPVRGEAVGPFVGTFIDAGYMSLRADTAGAPVQYFFKRTY